MKLRSAFLVVGVVGVAGVVACSSSSSVPTAETDGGGKTSSSAASTAKSSSKSSATTSASTRSSVETSTGTSSKSSSAVGFDAGGFDAGMNPYECTVPATPPSGGSCAGTLVAANDAGSGLQCNPVTNEGCTGGATCDISDTDPTTGDVTGFGCYPPPNVAKVCGACDDGSGPYCGPGTTCDGNFGVCAKYCCSDADCGAGTCLASAGMGMTLFGPVAASVGLCVLPGLAGDAGTDHDAGQSSSSSSGSGSSSGSSSESSGSSSGSSTSGSSSGSKSSSSSSTAG